MNLKFYQQKGFKATLCAAIILIAIPIVTDLYKEYFVSETGHFKIMGGLSIILAIGLLAKWKFVRHIAGILTGKTFGKVKMSIQADIFSGSIIAILGIYHLLQFLGYLSVN